MTLLSLIDAPGVSMPVPALIVDAAESAAHATLEFFTERIPNAHTRRAYGRAVAAFCQRVREDHADARTTRLYIRKSRQIAQTEVETVQL